MLNFVIGMALMIKFSGLPVWISIAIVLIAASIDLYYHNILMKTDHMRFMTIDSALMNIIVRITGK